MPVILTLDYIYTKQDKSWFTKQFSNYPDLFKWLREDSIIILPCSKLNDEILKKELILTKLALPKVNVIVLTRDSNHQSDSTFTFIKEDMLEDTVREIIINQHKIIDNRKNLKEVIKLFT